MKVQTNEMAVIAGIQEAGEKYLLTYGRVEMLVHKSKVSYVGDYIIIDKEASGAIARSHERNIRRWARKENIKDYNTDTFVIDHFDVAKKRMENRDRAIEERTGEKIR